MRMKGVVIYQPWASLVAIGAKPFEQAGITLLRVCEQIVSHDLIANVGVAEIFKNQVAAFRSALIEEG